MQTQSTSPDPLDGFEQYRAQDDAPEVRAFEDETAAALAAWNRPALVRIYDEATVWQLEADMMADDAAACAR